MNTYDLHTVADARMRALEHPFNSEMRVTMNKACDYLERRMRDFEIHHTRETLIALNGAWTLTNRIYQLISSPTIGPQAA